MKKAIFETMGLTLDVNILEDNSDSSHEDFTILVNNVIEKKRFCADDPVSPGDQFGIRKRRGSDSWNLKEK